MRINSGKSFTQLVDSTLKQSLSRSSASTSKRRSPPESSPFDFLEKLYFNFTIHFINLLVLFIEGVKLTLIQQKLLNFYEDRFFESGR
jgi:hypothetical protein